MLKWFATALALAGVAGSQPTLAADVVINNGQTPQSDPTNVIDDATYASDRVFVRNVGCPPPAQPASASCPSPGIRTRVASRPGGETSGLLAYDTSHIELSDGIVHFGSLATHQTATANFTGGSVDGSVYGYDDSSLVVAGGAVGANLMSYFNARIELRAGSVNGDAWAFGNSDFHVFGGTIAGTIYATDTATVTIYGNGFELNGQPVGFGPLAVSAGTLTGVLTNGQSISNAFQRIGGVIVLVEACVDPDLDGYGIFTSTSCLLGSNIDCDNNDPDVFPGNPEICDGKDNDCEWIGAAGIDNGLDTDADGDGVSIGPGCLLPGNDCDDADPNNYPGNAEICDGQDNDCVEGNDDGLDIDADGDGVSFGVGCLLPGNDCDDADPNNYPGNLEICDGQDNNCVNGSDEGLDTDADGDGVSFGPGCLLPGNDCDDAEPAAFPGNPEVCDGLDNDCDGEIDGQGICVAAVPITSPVGFVMLAALLSMLGLAAVRRGAASGP